MLLNSISALCVGQIRSVITAYIYIIIYVLLFDFQAWAKSEAIWGAKRAKSEAIGAGPWEAAAMAATWPVRLLSPNGVLHWVYSGEDLKLLCKQPENVACGMKKGNMLQLLGQQAGSSEKQRYKYGWQVFDQVRWLYSSTGQCIPIASLPATFHSEVVESGQLDGLCDLNEAAFTAFVNGNHRIKVKGKWTKVPMEKAVFGKGHATWKVVINPPGAEEMVDKKQFGTFAKVRHV